MFGVYKNMRLSLILFLIGTLGFVLNNIVLPSLLSFDDILI